ncbi:MAG: molybdopterin synthase sulfur carrier subunit [Archaeoglobus sp.]|jgi:molybdopterin converting factor small subunit|nr:MAG: molybdopterin synthase sulfur carrier subunit [Archaeoglobus sp.]
MVRVKVRLFARLREDFGRKELNLEVKTVEDVLTYFNVKDVIVAINNELVSSSELTKELKDGDVVDLMPPFSGG